MNFEFAQVLNSGIASCVCHQLSDSSLYDGLYLEEPGITYRKIPDDVDAETLLAEYVWQDGWKHIGPCPTEYHEINAETLDWWVDLSKAKSIKWEAIKRARAEQMSAPFDFDGNVYDADPSAQISLLSAATAARAALEAGEPWSVSWVTATNDVAELSAQDVISAHQALVLRNEQVFAASQQARLAIDSSTTLEEVVQVPL